MNRLDLQVEGEIKLQYAAAGTFTLTARIIKVWKRGEIAAPVMSASSGPKEYVKNLVFTLFEARPDIEQIAMMRKVQGVTFYLFRVAGAWYDNSGKQVVAA